MTATSKAPGADRYLPEQRDIEALKHAAETCRGCSLFADATQTVFGNGHPGAPIMLVGEQPGDQEDRAGAPFVGPAGRLLARALQDAGIDPGLTYQTNAVKHFKFTRKDGKRRIHQKPGRTEIVACRPWLITEIEAVHPRVIVCLGATAAQSLLGTSFRVSTQRGQPLKLPSFARGDTRRVARAGAGGDGAPVVGAARPQRTARRGLPVVRRRPAQRPLRAGLNGRGQLFLCGKNSCILVFRPTLTKPVRSSSPESTAAVADLNCSQVACGGIGGMSGSV